MQTTFLIDILPLYTIYHFYQPWKQTIPEKLLTFTTLFIIIGFSISYLIPTLNPHWLLKWEMEAVILWFILITIKMETN